MAWHKKLSRTIRGRLRKKVLSRSGIGVCAETANGLFIVDPGDFVVSRSLLQRGEYDRREIEWLQSVVGPNPGTIVIVGVHVGAVLVPLAKNAARVIGFEPNPPTFKLARLNLLLNQVGNVALENCAVGAANGTVAIVHNPINTGNASVTTTVADSAAATASMVSLDAYCGAKSIGDIDLLLIDIEGHEFHALRGADRTLRRTARLYLEYAPEQLREHGTTPADLVDFVLDRFNFMYLFGREVRSFRSSEARQYLKGLPEKKGLLLNLLLTQHELTGPALSGPR